MVNSQANLTPQEQQTLFDLMKKSGQQPTTNAGTDSTNTPDTQAQQGVGNVDSNGLQQLFGQGQAQTPPLQQQPGDLVHPAQAIQQIAQKIQGPQLIPMSNGQTGMKVPVSQPLLRLLGVKHTVPVDTTNFLPLAQKMGINPDPSMNLPTLPDGTPLVTASIFKDMVASKLGNTSNNPPLDKNTAVALKVITPDQAEQLYTQPGQTIGLNELRLGVLGQVAQTRAGMLGLGQNKLEQQQIDNLIKGISDAQQSNTTPMGQQANKLNSVIHARQLVSQGYNPDTGEYDLSKAASKEMIMGVARAISPGGVIPEQTQQELDSPTAYGRMKGLVQYWTGAPTNATPQQLIGMYRDMLDRQGAISQDLFNASAARELPKGLLLKQNNPLAYAAVLQNSFGTHDYRSMVANGEDANISKIPAPIQLGGRGQQPPPVNPQQGTPPPQNPGLIVKPTVKRKSLDSIFGTGK